MHSVEELPDYLSIVELALAVGTMPSFSNTWYYRICERKSLCRPKLTVIVVVSAEALPPLMTRLLAVKARGSTK